MIDVSAIQLKDLATVYRLDYLSREDVLNFFDLDTVPFSTGIPIMMVAEGKGFTRASSVLVNGAEVQFTIIDDSRMYLTLPKRIADRVIESVFVVTDRESFTNTSMFSFGLGKHIKTLKGPDKLIAQFVKALMTTPGSDVFDPGFGGGLQKIPGSITRPQHLALAQIALILTRVAEQIAASQQNIRNLPLNERMRNVDVLRLNYTKGDPTSIEVVVAVRTADNTSTPANLLLGAQNLIQELMGT